MLRKTSLHVSSSIDLDTRKRRDGKRPCVATASGNRGGCLPCHDVWLGAPPPCPSQRRLSVPSIPHTCCSTALPTSQITQSSQGLPRSPSHFVMTRNSRAIPRGGRIAIVLKLRPRLRRYTYLGTDSSCGHLHSIVVGSTYTEYHLG
jgi:hypothetical protein